MNAPLSTRPQVKFRAGKLWSLWEMLEFNGAAFYRVTSTLQHIWSSLKERGLDEYEKTQDGGVVVEFVNDPQALEALRRHARELQSSLLTLGTRQTSKSADRLIKLVAADEFTNPSLVALIKEIDSRLFDELQDIKILSLSPKDAEYFAPTHELFGSDFSSKFVSEGAFELDEAAKCLALGRPTASVFHLMRLMEIGIRALARCLDVPDPVKPAERNWAMILKLIGVGINNKWPNASARMEADAVLFEELHASLDAVKNPWRNATMHVESKRTEDEAEHIFVAVKGFMKKLSARMDEDGNPKA